jgi:autotransporter-associated beta strand protein
VTGTGTLTSAGPGNVIKNGAGTLTFYADENWYSGSTTVNAGTLVLDTLTGRNGAIKGTVVNIGDGTGAAGSAVLRNGPILSPVANEMINDSATITFGSDGLYDINTHQESLSALDFTGGEVRTAAGGALKITAGSPAAAITSHASSSTALIDATGGSVQLNGARTFTVADGVAARDLEVRGNIADGSAASAITKTGAGRLSFTGTEANTYTGTTTVSGGTLELAKSSGVTSIAGSAITVNSGGTLLLGSSNQINDAANLTLASGTLSTGSTTGFSETLGTLTLSGTSSISLGAAAHLLNFANSSGLSGIWSGTLTIYGWTGLPEITGTSGKIYFGSTTSGLTSTQLAMISFSGFGPGSMLLTSGELVPTAVPEAGTMVAAAMVGLIVLWRERRRLGKFLPRLAA